MKKLLLIIALAALAWSCTSEDALKPNPEAKNPNLSLTRTPAEAIAIANQLANADATSSSRSVRKAVDATSVTVIGSNMSRTSTDTLIYAVDYTDNNGFVLISANKATEPILAIIDEGSYNESLESEHNTGYGLFLNAAKDYVSNTPSNIVIDPERDDFRMLEYVDTTYTYSSTGARVKVELGQKWPENQFCPNKIAGCVPVALTQMFTYFKPTIDVDLEYAERPFDHLTVNWESITRHKLSTNYIDPTESQINRHGLLCEANYEDHVYLAALVREMGYLAHSEYKEKTTSTTTDGVLYVLNKFLPYNEHKTIYPNEFYDTLKSGGIACVLGIDEKEGGHAWVADGVATCT